MKKLFIFISGLFVFLCVSPVFAVVVIQDGQIAINNQTGVTIYAYDWDYGHSKLMKAFTIANNQTSMMNMSALPGMRIYFSEKELVNSIKKGMAPDIFNPGVDGDKRFSFAEYNDDPANGGKYTIDLSFIDTFSFPLTIQFDNPENKGKEWGIKSLQQVFTELRNSTVYGVNWGNLIWADAQNNFLRVVGPNETMELSDNPPASVPAGIKKFAKQFPKNGKTLTPTNWGAWQDSTTEPANSGYVIALHAAGLSAQPFVVPPYVKTDNKFGYFTYPEDNANGEFTNVEKKVHATLTLYPANVALK